MHPSPPIEPQANGQAPTQRRIAIIGAGISGLAAASLLHPHHRITVYEKNSYPGGHSRTVEVVTAEGNIPVDTGFIVFNHRNYPLLTKLFAHLGVPTTKSHMSFGASIHRGWMEYGTQTLLSVFSQKRNLLRPAFWRMLVDIIRFNHRAPRMLPQPSQTLGSYLDQHRVGEWFKRYYLLAMGGAIWSTPLKQMLEFPAQSFIRFFENHGLLTITNQPQWYTVTGGSREYVKRLIQPFAGCIRLNCGAVSISTGSEGIRVVDSTGESAYYDKVIFACHANEALAMLQEPDRRIKDILSRFAYQPNRVVLHSDVSFMPRRRKAWASWIYLSERRTDQSDAVSLSYWMNHLQPLSTTLPIIATLNPAREPAAYLVHDEVMFEHPVFDARALECQAQIPSIQGIDNMYFCGAYQHYGFHEDGLASAVAVAEILGTPIPWK